MKCILCSEKVFVSKYKGEGWDVQSCSGCGLTHTKIDKLPDYMKYHRDDTYQMCESHFKNIFKKRFSLIQKLLPKKGNVLDIGAANGVFLDIFSEIGFETYGVEPSKSAVESIEKGHTVFRDSIEKANLKKSFFDVIVMNHTLEHVSNPREVLEKIYVLLKPGGILLIDVPNFSSIRSILYGKNWPYLLPLEHTYQFGKNTLFDLLAKCGFKVIKFDSRSGIFEFADPIGELISSLFGLKRRFIHYVIGLPLDIISTILKQGDSMTFVVKKEV